MKVHEFRRIVISARIVARENLHKGKDLDSVIEKYLRDKGVRNPPYQWISDISFDLLEDIYEYDGDNHCMLVRSTPIFSLSWLKKVGLYSMRKFLDTADEICANYI